MKFPVLLSPKVKLSLEFAALFLGLPLLIWGLKSRILLFFLLWGGAALAAWSLRRHENAPLAEQGRPIVLRFACLASILALLCWFLAPDLFLSLPRERPLIWLAIMLLYPLLSVWPQEILFRKLIYFRYAPLFGQGRAYIAASTLAFAFAHVIFNNGLAILMTGFGGFLFARTYAQRRSLLAVCLEHALYGCLLFTIGLGRYFYTGAVWK